MSYNAKLEVLKTRRVVVTNADSPYTLGREVFIIVDCSSGPVELQLPAVASIIDTVYYVKKVDSTANILTITPNGVETIDGETELVTADQYSGWAAIAGATEWRAFTIIGASGYLFGNDTIYINGTPITGGKCLNLDGVNEHVNIGNVSEVDFDYNEPFSVFVWVKFSSAPGKPFVAKRLGVGSIQGWALWSYVGGVGPYFVMAANAVDYIAAYRNDSTLNDSNWHLVGVTYDGRGGNGYWGIKLWIDGTEKHETAIEPLTGGDPNFINAGNGLIDGADTIKGGASFRIGANDNADFYVGKECWSLVYDTNLSDAQAIALYNNGKKVDPLTLDSATNLVGFHKCGDGDTYPTIIDHSASANDGTMTNMESSDIVNDEP